MTEAKTVEKDPKEVYYRLYGYLKPYKLRFLGAIVSMVLYGSTVGAVPVLIRHVLDDIFGAQDKRMLWILLGALIALAMFRGVFSFLQQYLASTVGYGIVQDIRNDINAHLLKMSTSFFERSTSGPLISSMTNDTLLVRTALTDAVSSLLRDTVRVVALLATGFYLDPPLAAIAFLAFPLGVLPVIKFGKKVRRLSRIGQDQFGGITSVLHEVILGHKVVQSFCAEDFEQQRFERENAAFTKTCYRSEKYGALGAPINEILGSFAIAGVILYGALSVMSGVRTQGDFIAFITAMFLLYEPLKKLGRVNTLIQNGVAAAERIFEIIDTEPEIKERPDAIELNAAQPKIEYQNISFAYPKRGDGRKELEDFEREDTEGLKESVVVDSALNDISLVVEPGQTIALVGMSGGGKSTLVNLLPRFYDAQKGHIKINGVDTREVTLSSLRKSIGVVTQHTFLFNDSVANNIRYGSFEATEDQVRQAAQLANAHGFISRMPEGYQTFIGEQGFSLSGGERARIALARALLKNAPILILDEATAALDSESEKLVQQAIDRVMAGRTVFVIAHRLATVRNASKIAVMVRGRLVELGTHDELLKRNGEYAKLYQIQFHGQWDKDTSVAATANV